MIQSPDVLVVGGGIVGLSIGVALARRGAKVRLLERGSLGREASWAGAGIIYARALSHAKTPFDWLMAKGAELHEQTALLLRDETGIDNEYRRSGEFLVAMSDENLLELTTEVELQRSHGSKTRWIDPAELREREPSMATQLVAVVEIPEVARFRPPRHLKALEIAARRAGVELVSGEEALRVEVEGTRATAVHTPSGRIAAGEVVLAAGAWTSALLEPLGILAPVRPLRGQIALLRAPTPVLTRVVSTGYEYLVPRDDGRVLVGSTREDVGFDKRTTAAAISMLLGRAAEFVPALANADVEATWSGLRPATPDGMPILGAAPGFQGLWLAAGHTRYGLHLGPITGEVMADLILRGQTEVDLSSLSLARYYT
ncbi:MAG: glycine oxidase ThiO [Myxococcota bacterium]